MADEDQCLQDGLKEDQSPTKTERKYLVDIIRQYNHLLIVWINPKHCIEYLTLDLIQLCTSQASRHLLLSSCARHSSWGLCNDTVSFITMLDVSAILTSESIHLMCKRSSKRIYKYSTRQDYCLATHRSSLIARIPACQKLSCWQETWKSLHLFSNAKSASRIDFVDTTTITLSHQ